MCTDGFCPEGVDALDDRPMGSQGIAQTSATARVYDDTDVATAGSDDGAGAGMVQEACSAIAGDAEATARPERPVGRRAQEGRKKRRRARSSGSKHVARNLRKLAAFNSAHDTDAAAAEPEVDHTHGGI